jgi:hypothetical protein
MKIALKIPHYGGKIRRRTRVLPVSPEILPLAGRRPLWRHPRLGGPARGIKCIAPFRPRPCYQTTEFRWLTCISASNAKADSTRRML